MTADKKFKRLVRERARRTGQSYSSARRVLLRKTSEDQKQVSFDANPGPELVRVTIDKVVTEGTPDNPGRHAVRLRDAASDRELNIVIGSAEASAIAFALSRVKTARPMTHDALRQMLQALGGRFARMVIGFQPESGTFTADVVFGLPDGSERHLDWRPSDSIALALRCDPPPAIFVPRPLLESRPPPPPAT